MKDKDSVDRRLDPVPAFPDKLQNIRGNSKEFLVLATRSASTMLKMLVIAADVATRFVVCDGLSI